MPLQLSYAAQADVPETLKAAYVEKDGKFVLDVEIPDTSKLDATNKAVRKERDEALAAKAKAESERDDVKREMEALTADGATKGKKVTELLEQWKQDTAEKVKAAEAAKDAFYAPMAEKVTRYELDNVLGSEFEKAGGRGEKRDRAIALAKLEGWTLVDGKVVRKSGGEITNATLDDFFAKDFRKSDPEFYKGTQATGGGSGGVTTSTGTTTTSQKPPTQWSSDERRSFIEEHGADKYRELLNNQVREGSKQKAVA